MSHVCLRALKTTSRDDPFPFVSVQRDNVERGGTELFNNMVDTSLYEASLMNIKFINGSVRASVRAGGGAGPNTGSNANDWD